MIEHDDLEEDDDSEEATPAEKKKNNRRHYIIIIYNDDRIEFHRSNLSADRALSQPGNLENVKFAFYGKQIHFQKKVVELITYK